MSSRFIYKLLRLLGIVASILLILAIGLHFWLQYHAKGIIENLVSSKSNGTLKLKIEKLKFNYLNRTITIENADFATADSSTVATSYRFLVKEMKLEVKAVLPIIFSKKLLIDSLNLKNPAVVITRLKSGDKKKEAKEISIPYEMGKIYSSIQDALQTLKVSQFRITDGSFRLINRIDSSQQPIFISGIEFIVDNFKVTEGKSKKDEKLFFSDNVILRCYNQSIIFPNNRHQLSFSRFRINIKKKLVEFDSCTISAGKTKDSPSSFYIYTDVLKMTNIDFDTLYHNEVIKADSVFCRNPRFILETESQKDKEEKTKLPNIEDIVQQLTGSLMLNHLDVSNADFDIRTLKNGIPNSYVFTNNNFTIDTLTIVQDNPKPISVKRFAMAIRNYDNFIKDSTYNVRFDSILFRDKNIYLSNFLFRKLDGNAVINSISIPVFRLIDLSWNDFIFDRKLVAKSAQLINPDFEYNYNPNHRKKDSSSLGNTLVSLNKLMDLEDFEIDNGSVTLRLKYNVKIDLLKTNLKIKTDKLLTADNIPEVKRSLAYLNFSTGRIYTDETDLMINNFSFNGKNDNVNMDAVQLIDKIDGNRYSLINAYFDDIHFEDKSGRLLMVGAGWEKGDIHLKLSGKKRKDKQLLDISKANINNTDIFIETPGSTINGHFDNLSFASIVVNESGPPVIEKLKVKGSKLNVKLPTLSLTGNEFSVTDNVQSIIKNLQVWKNSPAAYSAINIPQLVFIPHINKILNGKLAFSDITIDNPAVEIITNPFYDSDKGNLLTVPEAEISNLTINNPQLLLSKKGDISDTAIFSIKSFAGSRNSIHLDNITSGKSFITVNEANIRLRGFHTDLHKKFSYKTDNGFADIRINKMALHLTEGRSAKWMLDITRMKSGELILNELGKNKATLNIDSISLQDIHINNEIAGELNKLAERNKNFSLSGFSGSYSSNNSLFKWHKLGYSALSKSISADSISFHPSMSLNSFQKGLQFQKDYITISSGKIAAGPVNLNKLIATKTLSIGTINIDQFGLTDYKDKQLPFYSGIIKPLPTGIIRKIPFPVTIDSVILTNARIDYTENNPKTDEEGQIPITKMNARILNFKNHDIGKFDSLTMSVSGYLLDSLHLRLKIKESYTDSLNAFNYTLRASPCNLSLLNKVLIPLASVKIESGVLDTLNMRVIGREYLSLGEMKMYYRNLKVRFLKNSDETKRSLLKGLMTFIVNSFIIKKNNRNKPGTVFYIRQRDRSAINYLVKIVLSGIASSTGAKSNKKMLRMYKAELRKRHLPEIELDH